VRFLIDAQLPPRLATWLEARGHDAIHVFDLDKLTSDDSLIWQVAASTSAVIVTKDKDFVRFRHQSAGPQILHIQIANCSNSQLIDAISAKWESIMLELEACEPVVMLARSID
jgi:predicted nuclease of predicted toxin-antitoxin system